MDDDKNSISRRAFLFGKRAAENEEGATAIEYGLIAALISVALIAGATSLGNQINRRFRIVRNKVKNLK